MISGTNSTRKARASHFKVRRRRGSYLGATGKYPSPQNRHCLFFESFRERDLMVLLAFDPTVDVVEDHPLTIEYSEAGRSRSYTPDLLVQFKPSAARQSLLIEVKTEAQLQRNAKKFNPGFAAARSHCKAHKMQFRVITEQSLPHPRVRNLRFLFPYRLETADPALELRLRTLGSDGPKPIRHYAEVLQQEGYEQGNVISAIWRLAALQIVEVDLDAPLSLNSNMEAKTWATKI